MYSEFEEKEYEIPLIHQILQNSNNVWSPGQVFEGRLGIDTAILTIHNDIWNLLNSGHPLAGVIINNYNFGYIWRKLKNKVSLPNFKLNLFLQIKRCEKLTNRPAQLRKLGLKSPYWRFSITKHQQILLEKLDRKLNNRGIVAYASPAFYLKNELYHFTMSNDLVNNSTFVRVSKLNNHHKWVYDSSGSNGFACSEPEKIEGNKLFDEIEFLVERNSSIENTNIQSNLEYLSEIINESFVEIEEKSNSILSELINRFKIIDDLEIENISKNFLKIQNYAYLTNSIWLPIN